MCVGDLGNGRAREREGEIERERERERERLGLSFHESVCERYSYRSRDRD